ncbi:Flavin-containing monooxygenase FMO GS-OX5 [Phlyctochytrium planicorne]|nr:Flavin-containing monooxygenase FMO GS-OX5 [Phlyctochytrium planicorne]
MYGSLRTNLTAKLMQYEEFPFSDTETNYDKNVFPTHHAVLSYLRRFTKTNQLTEHIRFKESVVDVWKEDGKWIVRSHDSGDQENKETFDAVVVANGHYSRPNIPDIPGLQNFKGSKGQFMHSKDYRTPHLFKGKSVLCIGGGTSGVDIGREIATVASKLALSLKDPDSVGDLGESLEALGYSGSSNGERRISKLPQVTNVDEDGKIRFKDGRISCFDIIFFATGYLYDFPFLKQLNESGTILTSSGFSVHNLYKFIFYIPDPTLSFVGLPFKVEPFPLFQRQAAAINKVLLGEFTLPSPERMREEEEEEGRKIGCDVTERNFFMLGALRQYPYWDWCASVGGMEETAPWRTTAREELLVLRRKELGLV